MLDIVKPPNEALMRLSYGEKKAIYGARRVRVGTQITEGDNMFTERIAFVYLYALFCLLINFCLFGTMYDICTYY